MGQECAIATASAMEVQLSEIDHIIGVHFFDPLS